MKIFQRKKTANRSRDGSGQSLTVNPKEKKSGGGFLSKIKNLFKSNKNKMEQTVELTEEQKEAQENIRKTDVNNLRNCFTRSYEYNDVISVINGDQLGRILDLDKRKNLVEKINNWVGLVANSSDTNKDSLDFLKDSKVDINIDSLSGEFGVLYAPIYHLAGKMDEIKYKNPNNPDNRPEDMPKLLKNL